MARRLILVVAAVLAALRLMAGVAWSEPLQLRFFDWLDVGDASLRKEIVAFFKIDETRLPFAREIEGGFAIENPGGVPAAIMWSPLDLKEGGVYTLGFEARWTGEGDHGRASASFGPARLDFEPTTAWRSYALTMRQSGPVGPSSIAFALRTRKGSVAIRGVDVVRAEFDMRARSVRNGVALEIIGQAPPDTVLAWTCGAGSGRVALADLKWSAPRGGVVSAEMPAPAGDVMTWRLVREDRVLMVGTPVRLSSLPSIARGLPRSVQIGEDGVARIDGKPFFPMGLYLHESSVTAVQKAAEAGINLVIVSPEGKARALVEAGRTAGMQVLLETGVPAEAARVTSATRELVEQYGALPVFGWTAVDEPDMKPPYTPAILAEIHRTVARLDGRPLYQSNHSPSSFWTVGTACDILAVDPYPLAQIPKPLTTVAQWIDEARAAVGPGRAVWLIQQAFVEAPIWPKPPTPEQLRAMTFIGLNHGARGIVYYTVHEILDPSTPDHKWDLRRTPLWAEIARETAEMRDLSAFLLSPAGPRPLPLAGPFDGAVWEDGQGNVLVCVVNVTAEPADAPVRLPWADVELLRVAPNGPVVDAPQGCLAARLPGHGVLLLRGRRP